MGPYQNNGLSFFLQRCNPENVNSLGPFSVVTEQVVMEVNLFCFFPKTPERFSLEHRGIKLFYYVRSVVLGRKRLFRHRTQFLVIILTLYVYFMLEVTYLGNFLKCTFMNYILVQYFDKQQIVFIRFFCKLIQYAKSV